MFGRIYSALEPHSVSTRAHIVIHSHINYNTDKKNESKKILLFVTIYYIA